MRQDALLAFGSGLLRAGFEPGASDYVESAIGLGVAAESLFLTDRQAGAMYRLRASFYLAESVRGATLPL